MMIMTVKTMMNKDNQVREQRKLVEYYNYYLDGLLSNPEDEEFWELLYQFSFFLLRNIHLGADNRDDIWQDFIYDLLTMNSNYKYVSDFKQLTKVIDYKLKKFQQKYMRNKDVK